ncbi:MAG TPA: efflux RND transporter permease subunit [Polyangiaceae bacterium]|nr:efflux RND transporter permease subunit [Polyangiaceae bacterium]
MSRPDDRELVARTRNVARYFTEARHVAWVLLAATLLFGLYAYAQMPQRKDPFIKVRTAVAVCAWPGAPAEKVEELVTRKIEERVAQSAEVERIESSSRTGLSVVSVVLREALPFAEVPKAFDDIDLRLRALTDLPAGASPIEFQKDFGDTAALMLTVAGPKARDVEVELRAEAIGAALAKARAGAGGERASVVLNFPGSLSPEPVRRVAGLFAAFAAQQGAADVKAVEGPGFVAVDAALGGGVPALQRLVGRFLSERLQASRIHPDVWRPAFVGPLDRLPGELAEAAGERYSYRELDDFTDAVAKRLRRVPAVAKVTRAGVVGERIFLNYSQERLAALGLGQSALRDAIAARNAQMPGGTLEAEGRNLTVEPSGGYKGERDIGDTVLATTPAGAVTYVRDVVEVARDYEAPPRYLNFHTYRDAGGEFQTARAITLAVQMREGEHIAQFSREIDAALDEARLLVPEDLVVARTSDQPRQVEEKVDLFLVSLYEAIAIIVVVGFLGFREWRSALVLALSIPVTLAMTFVFMSALGVDIQQMSLAALILALGLLVDDPVVAGDAIKAELDAGRPRHVAAWLGPTKLARAILFATITNVVAYLPFLIIRGDVGRFVYALPVVMTCSLVASRLVSMSFIPLLGLALLRPRPPGAGGGLAERAMGAYRRAVGRAVDRRYAVLAASTLVLVAGGVAGSRLKSSFFPKDLSYLSYVDISLPEDASISATAETAALADRVVREVAADFGRSGGGTGKPRQMLRSVTGFVGGGAPRFWYSLAPQLRQQNYAQLVLEVYDDRDTARLIGPLQDALTARVPGARVDVRQLENGKFVPYPVEVRVSGNDVTTLRQLSERAQEIFRRVDAAERVRDDWGVNSFRIDLAVDPVRAQLAGVTNVDVATSSAGGLNGLPLNYLREGDKLIPIVARLRAEERGNVGSVSNLYVLSSRGAQRVPLRQISKVDYSFTTEKIQRRNQVRTVSIACLPAAGFLPSEVMKAARPALEAFQASLPPGYSMEVGGTEENVRRVAGDSGLAGVVSVVAILLTLVVQFKNALKPLIVFAAIPFGISGALVALALTRSPFSFMASVGVISLIGVIVSHVIVLFDYLEEAQEHGEDLRTALLDAGAKRLRPVLITVGATVLGLVPLAVHGGPLWEPLCYVQIGGLTVATGVTLVLVPVLYAIFAMDLKWVRWAPAHPAAPPPSLALAPGRGARGEGPAGAGLPSFAGPALPAAERTLVMAQRHTGKAPLVDRTQELPRVDADRTKLMPHAAQRPGAPATPHPPPYAGDPRLAAHAAPPALPLSLGRGARGEGPAAPPRTDLAARLPRAYPEEDEANVPTRLLEPPAPAWHAPSSPPSPPRGTPMAAPLSPPGGTLMPNLPWLPLPPVPPSPRQADLPSSRPNIAKYGALPAPTPPPAGPQPDALGGPTRLSPLAAPSGPLTPSGLRPQGGNAAQPPALRPVEGGLGRPKRR